MITDVGATVVTGVLFLVAFAWVSLFAKVLRRDEILAFEPRRETPWGWIAVVLSFVLLVGSQIVVGLAFGVQPDAEPTVAQTDAILTATAVAILAATLMSIGLIHFVTRADREDFGISLDDVPHDLFTGIQAFLILAPITFGIQYVCVYVFGIESHHPLIELLKEDSTGRLFGVVTLLAVVVAPISEEYFFRVLLQGWLERIFLFRTRQNLEAECSNQSDVAPLGDAETRRLLGLAADSEANPYFSPLSPRFLRAVDHRSVGLRVPTAALVPILISAAVFALMHWSHGPDPAALFVLALGLGYVYQRTHRWLPSVVTHACLNGTTMLMLWWFGFDELPS